MAQDRDRFLNYLASHNIMHDIRIRYDYSNVLNGMSIEVIPQSTNLFAAAATINSSLTTLRFLDYALSTCPYLHRYWPGKKYPPAKIKKDEEVRLYKQEEEDDDEYEEIEKYFGNSSTAPLVVNAGLANLQGAHVLTTVDKAKERGWTGKGIKVGILDTGVDYTHPSLGGCFEVRISEKRKSFFYLSALYTSLIKCNTC